jgi:hypothetical protein
MSRLRLSLALALATGLFAMAVEHTPGQGAGKAGPDGGSGVVRATTVHGVLLRRAGDSWQPVKAKEAVPANTQLVALPRADFLSKNGAVEVAFLADVGQRGPFPVLETSATFHASDAVDLDVTLDRGIIGFANNKKAGAAKVRLRFHGAEWQLTLLEPGTRCGVELYARHPPGLVSL